MRSPACHGIGIDPADIGLDLGWLEASPPAAIRVEVVDEVERAPGAQLVWQMVEPPDFGLPEITSQTWHEPDGSTWLGNTLNLALRVDYARGSIAVAPRGRERQVLLEALASVALPLYAQHAGGLVLHGAGATRGGDGVLICGTGGCGKSTLLMALITAGWEAISEDQCAVDWDASGRHRVWPGPSWVRLKRGDAPKLLVVDTAPRFEAVDKVAWDLSRWMARRPTQLDKIVLIEPPGGDEVVWEPVPVAQAVPELAKRVTWIRSEDDFARSALPQVVRLATEVPAFRMRLPQRDDWLHEGLALVTRSAAADAA